MKKLMTACAACVLAGMVSAQVESVNIVGYQTSSAAVGFTVFTPTFTAVGSANPVFGNLTGDFLFADNMQFFDSAGNVNFTAYWCDENVGVEPGWYLDDFATSLADTEIPIGQGFFLSTAAGATMTVAGEVGNTNITINCDAGFTVIGNPRPYAITYGDLQCTNMSFADNMQFFDDAGNVNFTAYWCDENVGVEPGWYLDDFATTLASTEIPAGQAFFFSSQLGGATCTIPALY